MASVYSSHNSASTRWLARAIQMLLEDTWPTDRTISFDGSGFPLDTQDAANNVFFEAVRKNGKVKSIRLRNQNLSLKAQTTFQNILSSNSNLRRLEFCNVSTSDSSELLLNTSFSSSNVQELLLQKCIINKELACVLSKKIENGLRKLLLVNLDLDMASFKLIEGIINGSLVHLELRDIRIDSTLLMHLIQGLESNIHLEELYLEHCEIDSTYAKALSKLVKASTSLKTLSLCSNNLDGDSIGVIAERGLNQNKILQRLILSYNPIGDVGAKHLTNLLVSNPTIQSLSIVDCEIWSQGCMSLAHGLADMKGLRILNADSEWENHIDIILSSIKSNFSLIQLWTDRTAMLMNIDPLWKQLGFYLRLNEAKRRLLVEPNVSVTLLPRILAESNHDATILYHFLSHKPDLVPAAAT